MEWKPFYLNPNTPPQGMELSDHIKRARTNGSEERLKQIADVYGMEFVSTKRIFNTRLAHEATEYAREHGKANEFHRVLFRRVYADGQDISDWNVIRSAAEEAGLDADEMQKDVEADKYREMVAGQVDWAYQIGVSGVPTYVINDKYAVVGAQPYEVFKNVLMQIKMREGK